MSRVREALGSTVASRARARMRELCQRQVDLLPEQFYRDVEISEDGKRLTGEIMCSCGEWFAFDITPATKVRKYVPVSHGLCRIGGWFGELYDAAEHLQP